MRRTEPDKRVIVNNSTFVRVKQVKRVVNNAAHRALQAHAHQYLYFCTIKASKRGVYLAPLPWGP
jgi:hypothetical protein